MSGHFLTTGFLDIILVSVLVFANGFFVAAEFAFVRLRDTQLDGYIAKGRHQAKLARHILHNLSSYLSAAQLGITITSLGLGWFGEPIFVDLLKPVLGWMQISSPKAQQTIAFAVGFSVLTFLIIVVGEQGPKWLAIQRPLPASLLIARPLHWFHQAFYPFNWLLNFSSQWLLKAIGIQAAGEAEMSHSEEELRVMLGQRGGGAGFGREIVLNALDLSRRLVREVMRPRKEITAFDIESSISECIDVAEKTRYSRFPLCEGGDLDRTIGVVHIKDLYAMRIKGGNASELIPVARKLIYVPETSRLERLLQLFLERKLHFAIVVDEYGGTVGMVTLENILEELVGQIQDEFDQEKALIVRLDENTWELDGALPLHELSEVVGQSLTTEGIATTSGWVTGQLGGFPKPGDTVALGEYELRVEDTESMRVSRLRLVRLQTPGGDTQ